MKLGFLSDAHGNAIGLSLCLQALTRMQVEEIYFLGDAVGYLPQEREVLGLLDQYGVTCLLGNHDAMLLQQLAPASEEKEELYRHRPALQRLGADGLENLRKWPRRLELELDRRRFLLVHGSPFNELEEYVYPDADLARFAGLPYEVVIMGHTHRPFVRDSGPVTVINTGSCGLPRDQGNALAFVIYDTTGGSATLYRLLMNADAILQVCDDENIAAAVKRCFYRQPGRPLEGVVLS